VRAAGLLTGSDAPGRWRVWLLAQPTSRQRRQTLLAVEAVTRFALSIEEAL